MRAKVLVISAFVAVLLLPLLVRAIVVGSATTTAPATGKATKRLVVVTPHVEQIREEFGRGFSDWHQKNFGEPVEIDWRTPGGTTDIMKALEAQFETAVKSPDRMSDDGIAAAGTIGYDLFFGGGSFEHTKMKDRRVGERAGSKKKIEYRWGRPANIPPEELAQAYGENKIGTQQLYDPDRYWFGAALSGFGIVYNKQVLKDLGLPEPTGFQSLCDPRYQGLLALADGRQSGSVTTTYDSILNKEDWANGWKILRELSANARYYASASTKPPVDVSQGDAAAGLAIDFYGRGQGQFVLRPGETPDASRVGYVDPQGATYIDADPVSIVNGATDPELCERFVRYILTEEAQAMWQFEPRGHGGTSKNGDDLGPVTYRLRRMPVRRVMYEKYLDRMVDRTNPFTVAADVPVRGYRAAIGPLMAAFGIDTGEECRHAWVAMNAAKSKGGTSSASPESIAEMERLFYSMPEHAFQSGTIWWPADLAAGISKPSLNELEKQKVATVTELQRAIERAENDAAKLDAGSEAATKSNAMIAEWKTLATRAAASTAPQRAVLDAKSYRAIRNDTDSWKNPTHGRRTLIAYTEFFRDRYAEVVRLAGH